MTDNFNVGPVKGTELLWEQVYNYLKVRLVQGHFPPGHKLPAESELAKSLNVSRVSLREALQRLELEGYIERKRGVGTFVIDRNPAHVEAGIEKLISMSSVIRSRGHVPGTKETIIYAESATEDIAARLGIRIGDPVTVIDRVRTIDGKPIFVDSNRFPSAYFPATTPVASIGESLFTYVENKLGLHVSHSVARLLPALADEALADKLEVAPGTLLIKLDQVHYLQDNSPIWYSILQYRESEFSWYIVRTR
jgi:GntR family transcriptional regulator